MQSSYYFAEVLMKYSMEKDITPKLLLTTYVRYGS